MRRAVLYSVCLPANLVAWLIVLVVRLLWGEDLRWQWGVLSVELKSESWPSRTWYKGWAGTTFGHGVMYASGKRGGVAPSLVERHELVHVEQFEVCVLGSLVLLIGPVIALVLLGHWVLALAGGLGLLTLSGAVFLLVSVVSAWLRGEPAYRGSSHEESAYAQVALYVAQQKGLK